METIKKKEILLKWQYLQPSPRFGHSSILIPWNRMIILFGCGGSNIFLDDLHIFDVKSRQWENLTNLRKHKRNSMTKQSEPKVDGNVRNSDNLIPMQINRKLNLKEKSCSEFENKIQGNGELKNVWPSARAYHSACFNPSNNSIIVFGGRDENSEFDDLWIFSLENYTWKKIKKSYIWPRARSSHSAEIVGKHMYVFGGSKDKVEDLKLYSLELETMKWSLVSYSGPMPQVHGHPCCTMDDSLYVFGRTKEDSLLSSSTLTNEMFIYTPATRSWDFLQFREGFTPTPRKFYSIVSNQEDKTIFIFGGITRNEIPLGDLWCFNCRFPSWSTPELTNAASQRNSESFEIKTPERPCPRYLHSCTIVDSSLYVFGGIDEDNSQQIMYNDIYRFSFYDSLPKNDGYYNTFDIIPKMITEIDNLISGKSDEKWAYEDEYYKSSYERISAVIENGKEEFNELERDRKRLLDAQTDIVRINVGGTIFQTTVATLTGKYVNNNSIDGDSKDNMFNVMFSGNWRHHLDNDLEYFIDRDPTHFRYILNYLRDGVVTLPENTQDQQELLIEANFYQLDELVQILLNNQ